MVFAVVSFLVAFLLIASGGLLIFYRDTIQERITAALYPRTKKRSLSTTLEETRNVIGGVVEHFERVLPRSQAEIGVLQQRLVRAGYRKDGAAKLFYGAKVVVPVVLCILALVTGLGHISPLFVYTAALGIGFLAPDFWLGRQISKRQASLKRGLPDVLDMLIICIEAGLSLDQATARTAEELHTAQQLSAMNLES